MKVSKASFRSIMEHAKKTESSIQATWGGTRKVRCQNEFSGHTSRGMNFSSRSSHGYRGRVVQAALQESCRRT